MRSPSWFRNQAVFWLVALPIAGLGAAIAFVLDRDQQFADLRNHWGWDFLFALIYAMFLDRWMKITLLEGASPCEEVDNLRRSIISLRFLVFAACFLLLAMIMSTVQARRHHRHAARLAPSARRRGHPRHRS